MKFQSGQMKFKSENVTLINAFTIIPDAQKMSCQNIFISFPDFISYYKLSKDILKTFLRKIVCYNFLILREFLLVKNP